MGKGPTSPVVSLPVGDAAGFAEICAWLPDGWEQAMTEYRAFRRARSVRSPADLLRLIFAYPVLKYSLPELCRWAKQQCLSQSNLSMRRSLRWRFLVV